MIRERWEAFKDWLLLCWFALVLSVEWVVSWITERLPRRG